MDEATFKERSARLERIAKVLEKLPPEVRSAAFYLLQDYVSGTTGDAPRSRTRTDQASTPQVEGDREQFFGSHTHDKPADNVKLIAGFLYREYGTEPFSLKEIR